MWKQDVAWQQEGVAWQPEGVAWQPEATSERQHELLLL